jgi:hypothetical protein
MSAENREFNSGDIGRALFDFQSICMGCPRRNNALICNDFMKCPVGYARYILNQYNKNSEKVVQTFIPQNIPANITEKLDQEKLKNILLTIQGLCNRCMFHVEKCFLNIAFAAVETALNKPQRKPLSARPGDADIK